MQYLRTHEIQTYTRDRLFNSETPQARDFFALGTKYFDTANAFKTFSRDFRAPVFGKKKKKKKAMVRSCAVSDPESEDELVRRPLSDDEDDDEEEGTAEERLTAANIAGLSRKLDEQMEEERAAAEAELQEAAIQTNVQEDVLGPDGEDEKPMALLAPDLQLLRQRINDVGRVLGDFSNLAESGRSRADYTAQVLKDICAYYEYSPFLAEKLWNLVS